MNEEGKHRVLPPRINRGRPPVRWVEESSSETYASMAFSAVGGEVEEPCTFAEAMESSRSKEWMEAMKDEIVSLRKNGTWELTEAPQNRKVIQSRWVFKVKRDGTGQVIRHKARLVAKGFTQQAGIDYSETYSPVVRHDSLRVILAIAGKLDLEIVQMDVKTAFLYGDLQEELYMAQPTGFIKVGEEHLVCQLKRNLYGLKQASRAWNSKFNSFLIQYELQRSEADPCVYHQQANGVLTIVAIWVDDCLICSSSKSKLNDIVSYLGNIFEMTSGPADCFVGIQIERDRKNMSILLHQEAYLSRVLAKFQMEQSNPRKVPADPCVKLSRRNGDEREEAFPFSEAVGSLMYAMICTRPDIAFAVGNVAQFSSKPDRSHWEAVKRILAYIRGTVRHGITFGSNVNNSRLCAYSDSDFAGNVDDRRSTSGNLFMLYGGPVAWCSKRQKCISLSTTEAEYVAASTAAKELVWLRHLLEDIGCKQLGPTELRCDNQSAVQLVRNPQFHQRTKHIDVKYHHIRDLQERKQLEVVHVSTDVQLADILTKGLEARRFKFLCNEIGVQSWNV